MPHPATLRRLVDDYERARAAVPAPEPGAGDLAYTLCVITGTREIAAALRKARHLLAADVTAGLPPVTIPAVPTIPTIPGTPAGAAPGTAVPGGVRDRAAAPLAVAE
ncbi:DUF5133 domain-containing protein [Streptomyces sp. NPDC086777]|uniref:DUF5133 domain-containing protein n=1 Tax=Streptomyces sp. NPDC086777 TaxID=3154866 RepID=UPI00344C4B34